MRKSLSYREIAEEHNKKFKSRISLSTIRYWCKKWGINNPDLVASSKSKKLHFSRKELAELRRLLSFEEIAKRHYKIFRIKISVSTLDYWCKKWGI
ncbi:MAG: hypothetical protein KGD65_07505 [Candidatus Lokiarchaeota archaeon]|nr:hypothetical protein [Candidatus Lokiarchaeota archaeon]